VNVSCPECRSVFRVDPTKIPPTGLRARCSVCGGVIILGAGSSIEEEFGPPSAPIVVTPMEEPAAAPSFEPPSAMPFEATPAAAAEASPAAAAMSATPAAASAAVATPPRATPIRAVPSAPAAHPAQPTRPAAVPPRAGVFAPRVPPAGANPSGPPGRQPLSGSARPATPARPLAPPIAGAFPPRRAAAPPQAAAPQPAHPARSQATAQATASATPQSVRQPPPAQPTPQPKAQPPRQASPTPARLPINPFLANDPNAKARRLSRALVSDLVTYYPQRREEGLRAGTLRELFREEIKKSYEEYVEQVGKEFADSTTHFQEALNEILAGGQKIF
jgi:predicted Zn finger-like uncharacterized protein